MKERVSKLVNMQPTKSKYLLSADGATVPTDADTGYAASCIFHHTDGGVGTHLYINEGDEDSCDFNPFAGLTAAQEALLGATAGVATASTALILDASGHLASGTVILDDMAAGAGFSETGTVCEHSVTKVGGIYKTEILLDLTGLTIGAAAGDIIGDEGDEACHFGQITAAKNGTIVAGRVTCLETPAGGDTDIDFYAGDEGTGVKSAEDAAASSLTNAAQLINHGAWAVPEIDGLSALPGADQYLYAVGQAGGDTEYSAGIFLIELWGK